MDPRGFTLIPWGIARTAWLLRMAQQDTVEEEQGSLYKQAAVLVDNALATRGDKQQFEKRMRHYQSIARKIGKSDEDEKPAQKHMDELAGGDLAKALLGDPYLREMALRVQRQDQKVVAAMEQRTYELSRQFDDSDIDGVSEGKTRVRTGTGELPIPNGHDPRVIMISRGRFRASGK